VTIVPDIELSILIWVVYVVTVVGVVDVKQEYWVGCVVVVVYPE
jgi:hypothetical protein